MRIYRIQACNIERDIACSPYEGKEGGRYRGENCVMSVGRGGGDWGVMKGA